METKSGSPVENNKSEQHQQAPSLKKFIISNMLSPSCCEGEPENKSLSEGRSPLVVTGGHNTITIIEKQFNNDSASETVRELLDQQKRSDAMQKQVIDTVLGALPDLIKSFMPKPAPTLTSTPSPEPTNKTAKTKSKK